MKTLILSAALCLATLCAFGQSNGNSGTPVPIIMQSHENSTISTSDNQERSLYYWDVDAYVYLKDKLVEVNLYNIGEANVSLVNVNGKVVETIDIATDTYTTVTLHVDDSSRIYYIVVSSPVIYSEGSFEF